MTCEVFSQGESIFHRADPRVKLIAALALSLEIVWLKSLIALFGALILSFLLLIVAKLNKKVLAKRFFIINFFILFMWAILPWTTPGTALFSIGPIHISKEGVFLSLLITLKCNSIMAFNITLLSTSTIFSIAHALNHLKVPSTLVQLLFFSWRYLHVLEEEYTKLKRAAILRGFRPKANLFTYKTYGYLLGSLFIRTYDRGQRVYYALICRGFNGTFWLLSHFRLKRDDLILSFLILVLLAIMILLDGGSFATYRA